MSPLEQFDKAIEDVTIVRGQVYGHPADDFAKIDLIKQAVSSCPHPTIRHALEMIGVKLARLASTPDHLDSIIDIAGYARTIAMILELEQKNDPSISRGQTRRAVQTSDLPLQSDRSPG